VTDGIGNGQTGIMIVTTCGNFYNSRGLTLYRQDITCPLSSIQFNTIQITNIHQRIVKKYNLQNLVKWTNEFELFIVLKSKRVI